MGRVAICQVDGKWPNLALAKLEGFGRVCHKSEDKITEDSAIGFVRRLLAMTPPHESVLEHCSMTVRIVCGPLD